MQQVHSKIVRARAAMVQSQRFYGFMALQLEPVVRPSMETCSTDGRHLFYNPTWVEAIPMPELIGVMAHEVMHIANLHHTRRKGRDKELWNKACDYAINPIVIAAGFQLPSTRLYEPAFVGKSAEAIYRILDQQEKDDGGDQGSDSKGDGPGSPNQGPPDANKPQQDEDGTDTGGCGSIMDAVGEDGHAPGPAEVQKIEAETQVMVAQAANLAKAAGQGSQDIERTVNNIKRAHVDWVEETRRFVQQVAKNDYNWSRPNRRFIGQGVYLPSLHNEEMGPMVVFVDTSGSTSPWLGRFATELTSILEDVRPRTVHIVYVTDRVVHVDEINPAEDLPLKLVMHGTGGTSFIPAFEWVEANDLEPACAIYLTDLEGQAPKEPPAYPVLWAAVGTAKEPWGERVELTE